MRISFILPNELHIQECSFENIRQWYMTKSSSWNFFFWLPLYQHGLQDEIEWSCAAALGQAPADYESKVRSYRQFVLMLCIHGRGCRAINQVTYGRSTQILPLALCPYTQ